MNAFNGLLVTLGALASIAVGVLMLLVITETLPAQAVPIPVLQQQLAGLAEDTSGASWRDAGIAAAFIVVGLLVLLLEARTITRTAAAGMVLVSSDANGTVRLSVESIAQLAQRTARSNREIRSVRCRVQVASSGLTINCIAGLRMGSDVPAVTSDIQHDIREVVERLTGLNVIDVPVRARYQGDRDQPVLTR
jgi:uncharacterized alkaline shock family protein YloU